MSSRTLIVTNDFPPQVGGIESFVEAMTARLGEQIVVYTSAQPDAGSYDRTLPFEVVRDPSRVLLPTPRVTRTAVRLLTSRGCDRVWFGAAAPLGLMASQLRRAGARTTVATTHGHEVWWAMTPAARRLLRSIGEQNDVVTYLGEYCRSRIAAALTPAAASRMRQLSPGVDVDQFRPGRAPEVRRRLGLRDEDFVVLCVSRLVRRKGQDRLIRAVASLNGQIGGLVLLIAGSGPDMRRLQELVDRYDLRDRVRLLGRVPQGDLAGLYRAADVFAMPARTRRAGLEVEGLGICYLEAAACGVPVIAGDSGGAPDAVQDGVTGWVIDGRDTEALAGRLSAVAGDPELGKQFGIAGREWVTRNWTWDLQAERLQAYLASGAVPQEP